MSKITIVTAFFDIGRGVWASKSGLPHYLPRTTDTYMERFAHMASLDNEMVIYTSKDLAERILSYRSGKEDKTHIVCLNLIDDFRDEYEIIRKIQNDPNYIAKINPQEITKPEYWCPEYVLINFLKSSFVNHAITHRLASSQLVAWIDFGYCRSKEALAGSKKWSFPFSKDKIHVFGIKEFKDGTSIQDVIANNDVYITGSHIIAHKSCWKKMEAMMRHHFFSLVNQGLMDDDQTLMLMSTLSNPDCFEVHKIFPDDWFVMFRNYNIS